MGVAEGLASPLKHAEVLALTEQRLLFFRKRFAFGRPKTLTREWLLDQVVAIDYDNGDSMLQVTFADRSSAGLHSPSNQWPHKLAEGFARLKADGIRSVMAEARV